MLNYFITYKLSMLILNSIIFVLPLLYPMLPVSLDCSFLTAQSVYSKVYFIDWLNMFYDYVKWLTKDISWTFSLQVKDKIHIKLVKVLTFPKPPKRNDWNVQWGVMSVWRMTCCCDWWFFVFYATFSNISAISWWPVLCGGRSRREPPTMGKQLINFITCGCESSAPFL